eukprot:gene3388-12738_t
MEGFIDGFLRPRSHHRLDGGLPPGSAAAQGMVWHGTGGTGRITLRALGAAQMDMPSMPDMLRKVVCGGHHSSSRSRSMHRSVIQTRGGAETETEVATKTRATTDETPPPQPQPQPAKVAEKPTPSAPVLLCPNDGSFMARFKRGEFGKPPVAKDHPDAAAAVEAAAVAAAVAVDTAIDAAEPAPTASSVELADMQLPAAALPVHLPSMSTASPDTVRIAAVVAPPLPHNDGSFMARFKRGEFGKPPVAKDHPDAAAAVKAAAAAVKASANTTKLADERSNVAPCVAAAAAPPPPPPLPPPLPPPPPPLPTLSPPAPAMAASVHEAAPVAALQSSLSASMPLSPLPASPSAVPSTVKKHTKKKEKRKSKGNGKGNAKAGSGSGSSGVKPRAGATLSTPSGTNTDADADDNADDDAGANATVAPWQRNLAQQIETAAEATKPTSAILHDALIGDGEEIVAIYRMSPSDSPPETEQQGRDQDLGASGSPNVVVELPWPCIQRVIASARNASSTASAGAVAAPGMNGGVGEVWGHIKEVAPAGDAPTTTVSAVHTTHLGRYSWSAERFTLDTAPSEPQRPSKSQCTLTDTFVASTTKDSAAAGDANAVEYVDGAVLIGWYITSPGLGVGLPSSLCKALPSELALLEHRLAKDDVDTGNTPLFVVVIDSVRTSTTAPSPPPSGTSSVSTPSLPPRRVWMECYNAHDTFAQLPFSL